MDNNSDTKQVEIGYTLDKNFRGYEDATKGLIAVIDEVINHLDKHQITTSIGPRNSDSIKLIKKLLGFRKEAHFVKSLYVHCEWIDDVIYAILAEEWKTRKP